MTMMMGCGLRAGVTLLQSKSGATHDYDGGLWVAGRRHSVTIKVVDADYDDGLWVAGRRHSVTIKVVDA